MAVACAPKQFTDASIRFIDNTAVTPLEFAVVNCLGDTSSSGFNDLGGGNRALAVYQTQGGENAPNGKTHARAGAHEPGTLTINVLQFDYTEATTGNIRDWVYRLQTYAAAVGFECVDSEVFSFIVEILDGGISVGEAADQTLTYTRCVCTALDLAGGEANQWSMTLQVLGTEVAAIVVP